MTSSCKYRPDDRVKFAYGELETARAEEFAAHLEGCPACRSAVLELQAAADLCRTVREAPLPEARWTKTFEPAASPWWKRPLVWAPAAAAACALLVWVLLRPVPTPEAHAPQTKPIPDPVPAKVQVDPLPVTVAEASGDVRIHRADQPEISPFDSDQKLYPGDSLITGEQARVLVDLDDQSRILIDQSSVLRLDAVASDGDRFDLSRGQAGFRVEKRTGDRPFLISVDRREVRVLGTVFAVGLKPSRVVVVGVGRGAVDVRVLDKHKALGKVRTGRQTFFAPDHKTTRSDKLGNELKKLMAPLMPEQPRPKKQARLEPPPGPEKKPEPAPETPAPEKPIVPAAEPPKKKGTVDSVESLVESLYKDTGWIFDDLRSQMDKGNWQQALDKLNNYLSDPESPNRDDALMLKAACLEKLSRFKEAHGIYRRYLENWPAGPRAREARQGLLRTRRHR